MVCMQCRDGGMNQEDAYKLGLETGEQVRKEAGPGFFTWA